MTTHNHTEYQDMSSTRSYISITTTQFLELIENARFGTRPGNGWGFFPYVICEKCESAWETEALFNTKGKICPYCGHFDAESIWIEQSEFKGEGAFINPVGKGYTIVNKN